MVRVLVAGDHKQLKPFKYTNKTPLGEMMKDTKCNCFFTIQQRMVTKIAQIARDRTYPQSKDGKMGLREFPEELFLNLHYHIDTLDVKGVVKFIGKSKADGHQVCPGVN